MKTQGKQRAAETRLEGWWWCMCVGEWLLKISHLRNVESAPRDHRTSAAGPCHQGQLTCPLSESLVTEDLRGEGGGEVKSPCPLPYMI